MELSLVPCAQQDQEGLWYDLVFLPTLGLSGKVKIGRSTWSCYSLSWSDHTQHLLYTKACRAEGTILCTSVSRRRCSGLDWKRLQQDQVLLPALDLSNNPNAAGVYAHTAAFPDLAVHEVHKADPCDRSSGDAHAAEPLKRPYGLSMCCSTPVENHCPRWKCCLKHFKHL